MGTNRWSRGLLEDVRPCHLPPDGGVSGGGLSGGEVGARAVIHSNTHLHGRVHLPNGEEIGWQSNCEVASRGAITVLCGWRSNHQSSRQRTSTDRTRATTQQRKDSGRIDPCHPYECVAKGAPRQTTLTLATIRCGSEARSRGDLVELSAVIIPAHQP